MMLSLRRALALRDVISLCCELGIPSMADVCTFV